MVSDLDLDTYKRSYVRISTLGNECVGAGLLVGKHQVLTAAHVVNAATNREIGLKPHPTERVCIDFPLLAGRDLKPLRAYIDQEDHGHWFPPDEHSFGDIAILTLCNGSVLPPAARPAILVPTEHNQGHKFLVCAYPEGRESTGVWVTGSFTGPATHHIQQIESDRVTGHRVKRKFSGAPVWDLDLKGLAGFVVKVDDFSQDVGEDEKRKPDSVTFVL